MVHGKFREGSGKVQGRFREGSGKVQERFRKGSGKVEKNRFKDFNLDLKIMTRHTFNHTKNRLCFGGS